MKRQFEASIIFVFVLNVVFAVIYGLYRMPFAFSMCVTFGTILYHLCMRWIVGTFTRKQFNYKSKRFSELSFEKTLYKKLGVRSWKKFVPTYDNNFNMNCDIADLVNFTCRNEVIHERIMLLSFVPILFGLYAGAYSIFVSTSIIACLIDSIFVILQRYNRPRLVRLIERKKK